MNDNQHILPEKIVWETQEYEFTPKSRDWYWVVGIVAGGVVIASFIAGNVLFGILIAVAAFTVMLFGARPPQKIHAEITSQGISLNHEFHAFKSLESFWINTQGQPVIIFKSRRTFSPYLIVPLEYLNPENTREFLVTYLKEEEHQIPFAELLSRRLGF